jgi:type IV pilus assembly protein PilC
MMKAGVPLLQAFDIVGRGSTNPRMTKLLNDIRSDVETGTSLSSAFRKHPMHFDACTATWSRPARQGGILEALLDRLAIYQEKTLAIKAKIKSALMYPIAVMVVAFVVRHGDHDLRHPGLQGGLHVLRRRPARPDAVR